MKAIVKKKAKKGLWLADVKIPKISNNEVLIKVKKTSICGTDLHIYNWDEWAQKNVPIQTTIGHEFMGVVAEVGSMVKTIKPGDRVSGEGHTVCGHCVNCLQGLKHICPNTRGVGYHHDGAFAEYVKLPASNVFQLPDDISDELAAIFDPFGNAVHTVLSFSLPGEDVLITGAGPIGIMAAAVANKAGARNIVITDMNEYRLNLAQRMGATNAINISHTSVEKTMKSLTINDGFTVGYEMSGSEDGFKTILQTARPGAHIALLGILPQNMAIDWDLVIFKMLNLKGIYGREIFRTWFQMVHLIESGLNLTPVITHHFKADDFEEAFDVMKKGECGKIILDWE